MSEYKRLIINPNKLTLPDGRILARYYPDMSKWELLNWYHTSNDTYEYMGSSYTDNEKYILKKALSEGCWVDFLECEEAREKAE